MLSFGLIIPSLLVREGVVHPPYFTIDTYLPLRGSIENTQIPLSKNRLFYDAYLIVLIEIIGFSLPELLLKLPLAGILITFSSFLLVLITTNSPSYAGLLTLVVNLVINRGPWSYSVRRIDFAILCLFIIFMYIFLRDRDPRIGSIAVATGITLNLFYYTGGTWTLSFISGILAFIIILSIYGDKAQVLQYQTQITAMFLILMTFFFYFTDPIYVGFPRLISSFDISIFQSSQQLSDIETIPGRNNILFTSKLIFLGIITLVSMISVGSTIWKIHQDKQLKNIHIIISSAVLVAFSETVLYFLVGLQNFRLFYFILPLFLPELLNQTRQVVFQFLNIDMNLRAIICIILILSCTIFIYTIPHGTLNRSDPTEIQSASDWIATNSPEATVKSGLYSQTYIPLGNNLRPSFILESDYKSIITGERIGRDTYLLLSSTEMEYPIRTTAWITYKPINCYQEYQGQLNTKIYDGGDRSVMDMSTNGANINIPSEYDCEYK